MSENFTVTKATLAGLLEAAFYTSPDDSGDPGNPWGPYGPIGPVTAARHNASWSMLNPQPLPPVAAAHSESWRRLSWAMLNPQPLPPELDPHSKLWRSAQLNTDSSQSETSFEATRASIREFVDDYCGTGHPRWPLPWPWPMRVNSDDLDAMELLAAGAQFHKAAEAAAECPLQEDFSVAATTLFEIGVRRLESR